MDDSLKEKIIASVSAQLPDANKERLETLLELIVLEVESYNTCGNDVPWEKLQGVITEVLYQSANDELKTVVASVKRGDTTISYASKTSMIQGLLVNYLDLIKRTIGCGGLEFF
ncbi:hypothetical protein [Enterococcus sp. SMC-9]|uniref:hypothetical protein n=1 Tax=Enterococcus sp. SMC-9 TaxID=2862343 RepID=UPI001E3E1D3F|nr:hypothetical protein [Enterococcus sp. SMC-9]MCD1025712.1 hypothetical protein [Enterococcus sp. SMC-9]